jgi:TatD DNase family protein
MEIPFVNIHTHREGNVGANSVLNIHQPFSVIASEYVSVGMHPWYLEEECVESDLMAMKELLGHESVLAIGECGLDRRCAASWDLQWKVFRQQLIWASDLNKPLIIHCVRAQEELIRELKKWKVSFLFHGFNRGRDMAQSIIQAGGYLGISPSFLANLKKNDWIKEIPLDKVLLETDDVPNSIEEMYDIFALKLNQDLGELKQRLYQNTIDLGIKWK